MDFPSKDMRQAANCQLLVMSLYQHHCPTEELKQCYCRVTSTHCEGDKKEGEERARQGEKLHHKTVGSVLQANHICSVQIKYGTVCRCL